MKNSKSYLLKVIFVSLMLMIKFSGAISYATENITITYKKQGNTYLEFNLVVGTVEEKSIYAQYSGYEFDAYLYGRLFNELIKRGDLKKGNLVITFNRCQSFNYEYVALENEYKLYTENEGEVLLKPCYIIHLFDDEYSYNNIVAMMMLLKKLNLTNKRIDIEYKNINKVIKLMDEDIKKLDLDYSPSETWSPDKDKIFQIQRKDRSIKYLLKFKKSDINHLLEVLDGFITAGPVWSLDSNLVAYASLNQAKIYNLITQKTKIINLIDLGLSQLNIDKEEARKYKMSLNNTETLIAFDSEGDLLYLGFDSNGNYEIYSWNYKNDTIKYIGKQKIDLEYPKEFK